MRDGVRFEGLRVATIEDGGIPIELIRTALSDAEIWDRARGGRQAPLYAAGRDAGRAEGRADGQE